MYQLLYKYLTALLVISVLFTVPVSLAASFDKVLVPGGHYQLGCSAGDARCDTDEGPVGGVSVRVESFWMSSHEVSVAEYHACVEEGVCSKPFGYLRTHYCNYGAPGRDNYPLNCVNWKQALQYCQWQGARLAYDVEWEWAARNGATTEFPWGREVVDCSRAVIDPFVAGKADTETDGCWRDLTWPRGSFPPNQYGLYDMIGGTSEWLMDWYQTDAHRQYYGKGVLTGPPEGNRKVIKGGSWDEKPDAHRVSNRFAKPITGNPDLYGSNGIRCVIPVNEKELLR